MSDTTTTDPGFTPVNQPAAAAPPPAAVPPPAPPVTAPAPAADNLLDGDLPDQPLFDQGYVRDLRGRATTYRTQLREAEQRLAGYQVFDQYDDADRQVWVTLADTYARDPKGAAETMQAIAQAILGDPDAPGAAAAAADAPAAEAVAGGDLSVEAVQKMIAEAVGADRQQREQEQAIATVYDEVRAGGYDPESMDGFMVLWIANHQTSGDIPQAIDALKARDQAIRAAFVAERTGQPHAGLAPSNGAVATSQSPPPETWDDTRKAAQRFVSENLQPGQA